MKKFVMYFFMAFLLVALSGCYEPVDYLVTFNIKDNINLEEVLVEDGNVIVEPDIDSVEGYTFSGWYTDTFYVTEYDFETEVDSDINLYGKWIINTYYFEILLVLDGEAITTIHADIEYGVVIDDDHVTSNYHDIEGWYLDEEFTTPFVFNTMPAHDLTIYGKLVPKDVVEDLTYQIAFITDSSSIDDNSVNQAAWLAILDFVEGTDITYKYYRPLELSDDAFLYAIELAIENGAEIVVLPNWMFESAVYFAQQLFPNTQFVLMDGTPHNANWTEWETLSNTVSVLFNVHEAGFLAGYATVKEGYYNLGFTGGMPVPQVVEYGIGFIAGAYYAAEEMGVTLDFGDDTFYYFNDFSPYQEHQNLAASWYANGTEVIFSVAGGANYSVIAAAADSSNLVIGVDYDQSGLSSTILTSAMKDYTSALSQVLGAYYDETLVSGGALYFGITNDGVALPMDSSRFSVFTQTDYDTIYALLVNGTVVVPRDYAQLVTFLGDATGYPSEGTVAGTE